MCFYSKSGIKTSGKESGVNNTKPTVTQDGGGEPVTQLHFQPSETSVPTKRLLLRTTFNCIYEPLIWVVQWKHCFLQYQPQIRGITRHETGVCAI